MSLGSCSGRAWICFVTAEPERRLSYAQLAKGQDLHFELDENVTLKPISEAVYVGKPIQRVDIR